VLVVRTGSSSARPSRERGFYVAQAAEQSAADKSTMSNARGPSNLIWREALTAPRSIGNWETR